MKLFYNIFKVTYICCLSLVIFFSCNSEEPTPTKKTTDSITNNNTQASTEVTVTATNTVTVSPTATSSPTASPTPADFLTIPTPINQYSSKEALQALGVRCEVNEIDAYCENNMSYVRYCEKGYFKAPVKGGNACSKVNK